LPVTCVLPSLKTTMVLLQLLLQNWQICPGRFSQLKRSIAS